MQRRQFLRAAGAGALGGVAAPAAAQEDEEDEGAEDDGGGGGGATETVIVGPGGDLVFDPETAEVPPGTTVVWEWDSDGHNVNPTSIPEDAEWEGHPDVVDAPNTYEHTFDTEGTYEYECTPHVQADMLGEVVVDPDAGGGGGAVGPAVPASAMTLAIGLLGAMTSAVAFTFFFLKYGRTPDAEE